MAVLGFSDLSSSSWRLRADPEFARTAGGVGSLREDVGAKQNSVENYPTRQNKKIFDAVIKVQSGIAKHQEF